MKHKITTLFILTFIMFIAFNCGTSGSARGDYSECEPEWINERPESDTDEYNGAGFGESNSRGVSKNLAIAKAGQEVVFRFVKKKRTLATHPHKAMLAMAWLEILYNEMVKNGKKSASKYLITTNSSKKLYNLLSNFDFNKT